MELSCARRSRRLDVVRCEERDLGAEASYRMTIRPLALRPRTGQVHIPRSEVRRDYGHADPCCLGCEPMGGRTRSRFISWRRVFNRAGGRACRAIPEPQHHRGKGVAKPRSATKSRPMLLQAITVKRRVAAWAGPSRCMVSRRRPAYDSETRNGLFEWLSRHSYRTYRRIFSELSGFDDWYVGSEVR